LVLPALSPQATTFPIDLATALRLGGIDNPTIALAEEAVRASQADQLRAQVLLLPNLNAGFNYNYHDGTLLSARGIVRDVTRQALYTGAGAGAVGAGTVAIPGIQISAQVADAVFDPSAARQRVTGRRFDALATRNAILLDVAARYLDLSAAQSRLLATAQSEREFADVARETADFAKVGLRRQADADRAFAELQLLRIEAERRREEVAVASNELARLLNLDPSAHLHAPDGLVPLVELVDPHAGLDELIQIALTRRPELGARTADVAVNETLLRKERVRPFVPFLVVGFSAGQFGGGSNLVGTGFGHFGGRTDFDALAVWTFQNLGLGNLATQRRLRADVRAAMAERTRTVNLIRREVAEAYALVRQLLREVEIARRRLASASDGYRLDSTRARNAEGRPIEVLNSARLLYTARQNLVVATVAYDRAQFQLFVALGQPPTEALGAGPSAMPSHGN
jgi:outer membrane protein TolC